MPAKVAPERLADILGLSEDEFVERLTGSDHEMPPNYEDVIAINLGAESVETDEATELEMGPNRCSA